MKVLFLLNLPSPYRIDFLDALSASCDLTILFERKFASDRDAQWLAKRSEHYEMIFLKGIKSGTENAFCPSVLTYLKKNTYDLIIVGGYSTPTSMLAILWMKLRKIPYILNADGGYIKPDHIIKKTIKRFFISGASGWICTSKTTKAYFIHYGANPNQTYIYPFSSLHEKDILTQLPKRKEKSSAKQALNIVEDKVVLSIGQFIHRKGFDVLLNAWKGMPDDAGLYIIGDEPTAEYLNLEQDLHLQNVHFIRFTDKQTLSTYYTASDLFVLPTREDIWGLVIAEAMSFGLPVITTDQCVAGLALVDETNGAIIPSENVSILHDRIKKALSNRKDLNKLGQNSLNKIAPYTIENMAKAHVQIFNKLLNR